jgi:MFS family permease
MLSIFSPGSLRPRVALAIIFAMRGFLVGSWIARIPAIADHLDVSRSELGSVLIAGAIGALVAFQVTAPRIADWGTARSIGVFGPLWVLSMPLALLSPEPALFFAGLLLFGFMNGTVDVALNAQAVEIERQVGRPVLSSMHGMFSVGALGGTATGGALAAASVGIQPQFLVTGVLAAVTWILLTRKLAPDEAVTAPVRTGRRPIFSIGPRVLWPLGAIAFCCGLVEESLADWGALYLSQDLGTNPGTAALGYTIFSCTMLIGRLFGDPLVRWAGPVAMLRGGAALGSAGMLLGVVINAPWAFLATFGLVGLGFSTIIPIVYRAAGSTPGVPRAEGVAAVATVCYAAFLVGPPVMGFVADLLSLRAAFLGVGVFVTIVIALAPAVVRPVGGPVIDAAAADDLPPEVAPAVV